jgi:hypothetical protein
MTNEIKEIIKKELKNAGYTNPNADKFYNDEVDFFDMSIDFQIFAISMSITACKEYVENGCDLKAVDSDGMNALFYAIHLGNLNIIEYMAKNS